MRGPDVWASETYKLLAPYQNKRPGRVLALNKGRWGLPDEKRGEFLQHYLAEREQYMFGLVLLKTETHPHVMDLDHLELASAVGSPVEVLKIVLDVFTEALGDSAHLGACVMLETRQDKRFHAVFPDLAVNERAGVALHRRHVQLLSEHHPAIKWRDIVDESVVKKNGLRMLGSYKYDDVRDARGKVKRFEFTTDTGVVKAYTKKACLEADGFYVPCTIDWETGVIEEQPITMKAIEARSLCRPDLSPTDVVTVLGSDPNPQDPEITPKGEVRGVTIPTGSDEEKAVVLGLLELLKTGRYVDDYSEWRDIAIALKNSYGERYRDAWVKFSRQSPKFDLVKAHEVWDGVARADYEGPRLTVASLHHKARLDSPNAYQALVGRSVKGKVDRCIADAGAGYRVAELFAAVHGSWFKCVDITKRAFYIFRDHRWHLTDISEVNVRLSTSIYEMFVDRSAELARAMIGADEMQQARLKVQLDSSNKIAQKLLDPRYKTGVWTEVCHLLRDNKFVEKLDTRPELIGFENGVYDNMAGRFRAGEPEDWLTFSTGYDFSERDDEEADEEIKRFFASCFDSVDVCVYLLRALASCLYGYRRFEEFYILTGAGRNGKGCIMELMTFTMGDYLKSIKSSFFTHKARHAGAAIPELADKKGVRVLISGEPEEGEKIQIANLKELTGGDKIMARGLYAPLFYYKPMFGIFLSCNTVPELSAIEAAIIERLRLIMFPYVFKEVPVMAHRKAGDPSVKEVKVKSQRWRQQFMRILIRCFSEEVKDLAYLTPPEEVAEASKEYIDSCNTVLQWLQEHCEVTNGKKDNVRASEMYDHYRMSVGPGALSSNDFTKMMMMSNIRRSDTIGIPFYRGIRFKSISERLDDVDEE